MRYFEVGNEGLISMTHRILWLRTDLDWDIDFVCYSVSREFTVGFVKAHLQHLVGALFVLFFGLSLFCYVFFGIIFGSLALDR